MLEAKLLEVERRARELRESVGLSLDQYPVNVVELAYALGVRVYDVVFKDGRIYSALIVDKRRVPRGVVPGERATILVGRDRQKVCLVAHGLGHLVLGHVGDEGLMVEAQGFLYDIAIEREANLFAVALLMLEGAFRVAWDAFARRGVHYVAALFGVSVNAAVVRAEGLGLEVPLP